MNLHCETRGGGPDLVLMHGWGVNSGVWQSVLPSLTRRYRVTCVDLPGHGASRDTVMSASLTAVAQQILALAPRSAIWLGWSLGGLIALQAALHAPARVRGLILSNTTPRFITGADWPHAMPPAQLDTFAVELREDFADAVRRFLALQVLGEARARETLRALRDSVLARGVPDSASLAAGLEILRDTDIRSELHRINMPSLVIAGAYDRLTPASAGECMATTIGGAEFVCLPRTAHAPFISQPAGFVRVLNDFTARKFPGSNHEHAD